jgi:hypothetical protein
MITAYIHLGQRTDAFHSLVGTGSIPHYISQAPKHVVRTRGFKHGVESFEIRVDVREK